MYFQTASPQNMNETSDGCFIEIKPKTEITATSANRERVDSENLPDNRHFPSQPLRLANLSGASEQCSPEHPATPHRLVT
jgi:hypothetical protein